MKRREAWNVVAKSLAAQDGVDVEHLALKIRKPTKAVRGIIDRMRADGEQIENVSFGTRRFRFRLSGARRRSQARDSYKEVRSGA